MKRLLAVGALVALLGPPGGAAAQVPGGATAHEPGARVIVSTTLNDTLQFFDATDLTQLQPPLPSKGLGPVRLWVQRFGDREYLFAANHGLVTGSVGVFDLSGDVVTELPLSPFPSRPGSVGITAGVAAGHPMVFVTNTYQALAGCGVPNGSVTAYDAGSLTTLGLLAEVGTIEVAGAQPWAVSLDDANGRAYVSGNCADDLTQIDVDPFGPCLLTTGFCPSVSHGGAAVAPGADGPDATLLDGARGLGYTVNITSSTVSVTEGLAWRTTVPLPGAGPIDATMGTTPAGRDLLISSNGRDDSVSLVDLDLVDACAAAAAASCDAEVARIHTAVRGGAPEGVAYDASNNRIFVVNKTTFGPSLSVIQLTEHPDGSITGVDFARIPLNALGLDVPIPAFTAFDVVVQQRP